MALAVLSVGLGVALIALVVWDVCLTLLHPSAEGPLGHRGNRLAWRLVRWAAERTRRRLVSWSGPAAMTMTIVTWVGGLWIGFTLIYLPFVGSLSYSPPVPFGDADALDALYLSGVAITTVGFGDIVASTDALRLVTVAESASGLAVFTASITYVLSVYPLVSNMRTGAVQAADLGLVDLGGTARLITQGELAPIAELHRRLVENHQTVLRFPVLYYFAADDPAESVAGLFRAAINACLVLCWGVRRDQLAGGDAYCSALRATLNRVIEDYEAEVLHGRSRGAQRSPDEEDLRRLREIVAREDPEMARGHEGEDRQFNEFLMRSEQFLDRLAGAYGYDHRPLL